MIEGTILKNDTGLEFDLSQGVIARSDGSYVIMWKNGDACYPYHIPNNDEYQNTWSEIHTYVGGHPECVTEEQPYVPPVPTTEELAASVRAERDRRIAATDYLVMPDYPLDTDKLEEIKAYRQALRDLPQQPGFPWNGPDDPACPWPEKFVTQIDWPELTVNANIKAKLSF